MSDDPDRDDLDVIGDEISNMTRAWTTADIEPVEWSPDPRDTLVIPIRVSLETAAELLHEVASPRSVRALSDDQVVAELASLIETRFLAGPLPRDLEPFRARLAELRR